MHHYQCQMHRLPQMYKRRSVEISGFSIQSTVRREQTGITSDPVSTFQYVIYDFARERHYE